MPKRIQMSRKHPWRQDNPDAVIVARTRSGIFGNPWHVGTPGALDVLSTRYRLDVDLTSAQAVEWYDAWLYGYALHPDARPAFLTREGRRAMWDELAARRKLVWDAMPQLRGKDLACWCPLDQPCHADVLLRLANEAP